MRLLLYWPANSVILLSSRKTVIRIVNIYGKGVLVRPCPYSGSFSSVPLSNMLCSRAVNSSTAIMEAAVFSETSAFVDRPRHRYILEDNDLTFSVRKFSSVVSFMFKTNRLPVQLM